MNSLSQILTALNDGYILTWDHSGLYPVVNVLARDQSLTARLQQSPTFLSLKGIDNVNKVRSIMRDIASHLAIPQDNIHIIGMAWETVIVRFDTLHDYTYFKLQMECAQ